MKITKQRLKEIIKEELENSQNEGFFSRLGARLGRANKSFPIHYREFMSMIDDAAEKLNSGRLSASDLMDVAEVVYDSYDRYTGAMMKATGADNFGWTQELNKDQLEQHQELIGRMRKITDELYKKAKEQGKSRATFQKSLRPSKKRLHKRSTQRLHGRRSKFSKNDRGQNHKG